MKKQAVALAALGLMAGWAQAQSSVALYGVVDVALERIKGETSLARVTSGQQQGSRWGLRGTEDLGGGLKAVFLLENGFNADAGTMGQGGRLFGRQGYVGLAGNWGALRLGRQYTPMDDIASIAGTKTYDVVSVVPIIGNGDYNRVDNAITYVSPTVANTVFQLQYSLGEERVSTDPSRRFGQQAELFGGPKLTAYYDVEDKAAKKLSLLGAAVAYPFGATTVSVGIAQARNVNGSAAAASDDARLYTLQASHNLSKRTALYAHYTRVANDEAAALGFNKPLAGSTSSGVQVGIRHRF